MQAFNNLIRMDLTVDEEEYCTEVLTGSFDTAGRRRYSRQVYTYGMQRLTSQHVNLMATAILVKLEEHSIFNYCNTFFLTTATRMHNPNPTLTLTFDLWPNRYWWASYRDGLSLCQVFGDFTFSRFGFIVRTDRQNHTQRRINAILTRLPSVWEKSIAIIRLNIAILSGKSIVIYTAIFFAKYRIAIVGLLQSFLQ